MAEITVDRSKVRQYSDEAQRYYGVSQVVDMACGPLSYSNQSAMDRGTGLHRLFAWDLAVHAGWAAAEQMPLIPEEYAGYVQSWRHWIKIATPLVVHVEESFVSPDVHLPYAGTPDCVCFMKDKNREALTVVDLKTGSADRRHHLQVQAYGALVPDAKREALLYVDRNGGLPTWEVVQRDKRDLAAFHHALNLLVWRER